MSYHHGLDVRGLLASKDRSFWATETEDSVGSHYQAVYSEDIEDLVRAIVNCKEGEVTLVLWLIVVAVCKSPRNPITNPNPISSHLMHDSMDLTETSVML
jgi:hypothetical protein